MWTILCCATFRPKSGVPRPKTESIAAPSTSMRITTRARLNTSAGLAATLAPAARSGSLLSGERFQTTSAVPIRARLSAMGCPMTPRPMKPASIAADVFLAESREGGCADERGGQGGVDDAGSSWVAEHGSQACARDQPGGQDQHDQYTQHGDLGGRVGRRGIGEASACEDGGD